MGDKTFMMTMLLDFYGELLTDKQRSCFFMHYNEDLSLSEIAEVMEISRQGVRDLLVRAEAVLIGTEEKIGMIKRFSEQRSVFEQMGKEISELTRITQGRAREISQNLAKELDSVKN